MQLKTLVCVYLPMNTCIYKTSQGRRCVWFNNEIWDPDPDDVARATEQLVAFLKHGSTTSVSTSELRHQDVEPMHGVSTCIAIKLALDVVVIIEVSAVKPDPI